MSQFNSRKTAQAIKKSAEPHPAQTTNQENFEQTEVAYEEYHEGPIPSGRTLAVYDHLVPGSAKQIMDNAMENNRHFRKRQEAEQSIEKDKFDRLLNYRTLGMALGTFVVLIVISLGAFLMYKERYELGTFLIASTIGGILTIYILNRPAKKESEPG